MTCLELYKNFQQAIHALLQKLGFLSAVHVSVLSNRYNELMQSISVRYIFMYIFQCLRDSRDLWHHQVIFRTFIVTHLMQNLMSLFIRSTFQYFMGWSFILENFKFNLFNKGGMGHVGGDKTFGKVIKPNFSNKGLSSSNFNNHISIRKMFSK